ncbi:LOW QUALITY PROTEIN: A-kinase anchor protein 6 [Phycodurus eques]|uniref:LOW QUALITY PROTEIN: A-kinase anchor protein 6 n=1 Tax=Phycodurus eques TaxID=693459 RepID=UPI002ACE862B|nr:LOW QUALITY PROTEIN: A-kinase anchor protein 6 [Phycodurus eques]
MERKFSFKPAKKNEEERPAGGAAASLGVTMQEEEGGGGEEGKGRQLPRHPTCPPAPSPMEWSATPCRPITVRSRPLHHVLFTFHGNRRPPVSLSFSSSLPFLSSPLLSLFSSTRVSRPKGAASSLNLALALRLLAPAAVGLSRPAAALPPTFLHPSSVLPSSSVRPSGRRGALVGRSLAVNAGGAADAAPPVNAVVDHLFLARLFITMSAVTLSPLSPAPPSPALTAATPAPDRRGASSAEAEGEKNKAGADAALRSNRKPPPVHTGADWQVLLHLPQTEAWLRASGARVTQLTHSAAQDGAGRHVDAHLLQLKDICEDISDHVEQIHALLETEFSLKLLSYSVNIIVDIRTVQLLWHQLRVSVLVLKERLLQGLQDPNGNFTRETDILQAFSRDRDRRHQTRRLDALTEVDDCGQLTIRCSQDYFSLDCGITAFELSDYSPGDEPQTRENRSLGEDASQEPEKVQKADSEKIDVQSASPKLVIPDGSLSHTHPVSGESKSTNQSEAAKRSLPGDDRNTEPSLPKRVALISYEVEDAGGVSETKLGDSAPADLADPLMDPLTDLPDRSKFWLELDSVLSGKDIHKVIDSHDVQRGHTMTNGSSLEPSPPPRDATSQRDRADIWAHGDGDSDSSAPSPVRDQVLSSDLEASGEESDPRPPPCKIPSWLVKQKEHKQDFQASSEASADRVHWYGSEEFLALPAQIHKSEILAIDLDSLAHAMRAGGEDVSHDALQDVDDWDLTELKQDNWDSPESGDDIPSPPFGPIRRNLLGRVSPASSSDIAPSLDESIESGQLNELPSEEEGRLLGPAAPPVDGRGSASPVRRLLDDIGQDEDPDVWNKMAEFVRQLDGFIGWMQGALESTRAWTPPPTARLDALHDFLDTHLTFKLNVDSRGALKESIMEDGTALLAIIPAHQSGLRDILEMVSGQWEQLQLQIRRQHAWMLRALRLVRTRLLPRAGQSRLPDRLQAELPSSRHDAQRAHKLKSLQYASTANRERYAHSNSLQDFERAYEELWDRLTDADAAATTSDERRRRLFESSHSELMAMEEKKTSLLCQVESLKRSSTQLPESLQQKVQQLTHKWTQLENLLSGHSPPEAAAAAAADRAVPERLRASVEELKAWLRHTELLIFNSCLRPRQDDDAHRQLDSFESLRSDVRARRRRVSRVLKLCRKLLQQNQSGPEAERRRDALRPLTVNLERRWEAVVMQTLQWQNRLKKELGESEVPGNFLEEDLADLQRPNPDRAPPTASPPDDSWEWDETDMTAGEAPEVPEPDLTHDLPCRDSSLRPRSASRALPAVYQVYGLHAVEFHTAPELPRASSERKRQVFRKCLSKDSTFSSMESLPDLLGGLTPAERGAGRRSESESGIASDAGDAEMILCRGILANEDAATAMLLKEDRRGQGIQRASGTTEEVDELFSLRKGGSQDLEILEKDQEQSDQNAPKFLLRHGLNKLPSSPVLSPGSSLESLLSLGSDLFPSKDHLHRSASLESGLLELDLCRTRDEDRDGPQDQKCGGGQGELSSGELSRRTLDLLKRLENIQTPAAAEMTRSVSDMTLRSRSSLGRRPAASSSPGGRRRRGSPEALPSLVRESSPSLAELSGAEESSVGSEDLAVLPERGNLLPDRASPRGGERTSSARSRKRSGRREEADAVSLSMVVNVSCASACTDDEDDGDLLSSSTLTLTEEEMGVQEEEEERLTDSSSGNEDEAAVEESYVLGSDYVKTELQAWIRPPRASSETEVGLCDELRCGTKPEQEHFLNSTELDQQLQRKEENRRNASRSFISQFADDVENGNVERSGSKGKDEDDRLLREESGVFTKRGEALNKKGEPHTSRGELLRESFTFSKVKEDINPPNGFPSSPSCEFLPPAGASSLVGQLKGELPCQSASPTTKEGLRSRDRKAITIQEKLKFSSPVTEQSRSQLRDKHSCLPTKKWKSSDSRSCRQHLVPSPPAAHAEQAVHDFVTEILDLTSEARRSKEVLGQEPTRGVEISPASFKHIRHKVAQHSHRPLHLSRGDFYAYLSLSSHDSDCGEVAQRADDESAALAPYLVAAAHSDHRDDNDVCALDFESPDRPIASPVPSPPPTPDIRDEETLFPACAEEVYLGPPLRYNVPPGEKTPKTFQAKGLQPFPGEEARLTDPEEVRSVASATPEPPYGSSAIDFPPAQETPEISEISEVEGPQTLQGSYPEGKTLEEVQSVVSAVPEFPSGSFSAAGEASGEARRGGASLLGGCDVSGQREEAPSNEAPSYLNPRARVAPIDSSPAQCSADTKTLQSNIGAVMTKISVGGSATNPSKEPPASATRINPKINYRPIKEADRAAAAAAAGRRGAADARGAKRPEDRTAGRRRWELKSTAPTAAVKKKQVSAVNRDAKAAQGRSQVSVRPIRPFAKIHPSIHAFSEPLSGASPSCHRAGGGVHPEAVASQSQGTYKQTTIGTPIRTYGQFRVFKQPTMSCFWDVGGNRSARRKPTQARGEHANSSRVP